jgi:hypothetical protein
MGAILADPRYGQETNQTASRSGAWPDVSDTAADQAAQMPG